MSDSNWKLVKQYEHYSLLHNICFRLGFSNFSNTDDFDSCVKVANRAFENLEKGAKES